MRIVFGKRLFAAVAMLILAAASPESENTPPVPADVDQCADVLARYPKLDRDAAAVEYAAIGRTIAEAQGQLGELDKRDAAQAAKEKRAEIADLLFRQDCLMPEPEVIARSATAPPRWVTMTAYYATNRKAGPSLDGVTSYTAERDTGDLRFGRFAVSIPTRREPGDLNLPLNLFLFEMPADPARHFIVKSVTPLATATALTEMQAQVARAPRRSVLIFVHGYNVTFRDAALRTAQLAHDLNFPGIAIAFSWPSAGQTKAYLHDEDMSELSLPSFDALLRRVEGIGASEIFVVAHSMGNRVVTGALRERLATGGRPPANLKGLLLAAPDINADLFRQRIAPTLAALATTSRTIYASGNDVALRASSVVHAFPRVGLTRPRVQTFAGWEIVDTTGVAPTHRGWGHSYIVDNPQVIRDMGALILRNRPAASRGLTHISAAADSYWTLP